MGPGANPCIGFFTTSNPTLTINWVLSLPLVLRIWWGQISYGTVDWWIILWNSVHNNTLPPTKSKFQAHKSPTELYQNFIRTNILSSLDIRVIGPFLLSSEYYFHAWRVNSRGCLNVHDDALRGCGTLTGVPWYVLSHSSYLLSRHMTHMTWVYHMDVTKSSEIWVGAIICGRNDSGIFGNHWSHRRVS